MITTRNENKITVIFTAQEAARLLREAAIDAADNELAGWEHLDESTAVTCVTGIIVEVEAVIQHDRLSEQNYLREVAAA